MKVLPTHGGQLKIKENMQSLANKKGTISFLMPPTAQNTGTSISTSKS